MVSNYVVGSKKSFSGIIDYYERYEKKKGNNVINFDDIERMNSSFYDDDVLLSRSEKKLLKEYNQYKNEGGNNNLLEYIKETNSEKEINYGNYINYMNKNVKASGLFGDTSNHFSYEEKINMKDLFNKGQENGSVLWGNVYSFDNEFLEKHNLLDKETGYLNEIRIKQAVRESVRVMLKEENLDASAVWCGEIHYDTDNIHVHTSIVEMKNTRPMVEIEKKKRIDSKTYEKTGEFELQPKAKLKQKTLDKMKSTFANKLIDRSKDLEQISDLRFELHHSIKIDEQSLEQKKLLKNIRDSLPQNKKDWQYNNKKLDNHRHLIDRYNENYINKYHKDSYNEFIELLDKEEEFYKEIYGEGKENRYKNYKENKISELKSKMGNELLKEMKKETQSIEYKKGNKPQQSLNNNKFKMISRENYNNNYNNSSGNNKLNFTSPKVNLFKMNNAIKKTFRSEKHNRELEYQHNQLQQNIERDLQRQAYEQER
ncbi:hypothetical protein H1I77_12590 [Macrococcus bohemicus]|nr:hypothetical protein [Macrococcus bohemicus]